MGLRTETQLAPCEMLSAVGAGGMGGLQPPQHMQDTFSLLWADRQSVAG